MSIDTSAVIMVGLPYDEFLNQGIIDEDELDQLIDDDELTSGSYYYDSGREQNVVGFIVISTERYAEIDEDVMADILYHQKEFKAKFHVPGRIYLTPSIT